MSKKYNNDVAELHRIQEIWMHEQTQRLQHQLRVETDFFKEEKHEMQQRFQRELANQHMALTAQFTQEATQQLEEKLQDAQQRLHSAQTKIQELEHLLSTTTAKQQ